MSWISVKDKFPPADQWIILGTSRFGMVTFGIFMDNKFVNPDLEYSEILYVTHWMPLPNPPES